MNRGLPVLEAANSLDSWRRPEGSRPLGTRMSNYPNVFYIQGRTVQYDAPVGIFGNVQTDRDQEKAPVHNS